MMAFIAVNSLNAWCILAVIESAITALILWDTWKWLSQN
tara:strand:- start:50 stop:166 length:117 start_codon:yes stop_codon:yes gene_type:complete